MFKLTNRNILDLLKIEQVQNFLYLSFNHIIGQGLIFLAFSFLARKLSVENFGKFGYSQAFNNYFVILLTLGLPIYGVKKYVQIRTNTDKIEFINKIISVRILILIFAFLPYLLITRLVSSDQTTFHLILVMGIVLATLPLNLEWYFQAIQRMQYIAYANIIKSMFFLFGVVLLVNDETHITRAGYLYSISFILYTLLLLFPSGQIKKIRLYFKGKWKNEILKESIILGISFILIQIYYSFGIFILGFSRTQTEVGYFTSIYKILLFFLMGISLFIKAIFPYMATLASDEYKLDKFIFKITRYSALISLIITLSLLISSQFLVTFIFGEKYLLAVGPFNILVFIFFIVTSRAVLENSLIVKNKTKKYLIAVSVGASTNIILNIILTPLYGIYAAASVNLVSEIVFTIMVFKFTKVNMLNLIFHR